MKGIIALDIDGTILAPGQPLSPEVVAYLHQVANSGWRLIFITGRGFKWASQLLQCFDFSYYLAVQNGAITLEMPSKKVIARKYLDKGFIPIMQQVCAGEASDFILYSGYENDDICYYRPNYFSKDLLGYLQERTAAFRETWQEIASFDAIAIKEFPSVKCFGLPEAAVRIAARIAEMAGLHVPLIKDPFDENYYVVQATHALASKGAALEEMLRLFFPLGGIAIAAGDDNNDQSMLSVAHIKVVMATAPQNMQDLADVVAPPAIENGIIAGLTSALRIANEKKGSLLW